MPTLHIKPTHTPIKNYDTELAEYAKVGAEHEGTVRTYRGDEGVYLFSLWSPYFLGPLGFGGFGGFGIR